MGIRVVEQAVEGTNRSTPGEVGVRRDGGTVRVTWFCGDSRQFRQGDVTDVVGFIDRIKPYPDAWLRLTDSEGRRAMVQVGEDGELYASESDPPRRDDRHVPWAELRKALRKAA